jgi:hypothetical protein
MMAAGVAVFSAGDLTAQSAQPISLQVSGIYASLFGEAYEGLKNGIGGEAQLRFTPGALSIGAGGQYTRHEIEDASINVSLAGVFLEPRFVVATGSNYFAPYLSARFSLLRQSVDFDDPDCGQIEGSTTGATVNGGGGVLVRLSSRLNLDAGATYGYTRFGEGTISCQATGEQVDIPSGTGSNVIVRLGLAIGIGR